MCVHTQMLESLLAMGRGVCSAQPGELGTTIFFGNTSCTEAERMGGFPIWSYSRKRCVSVASQARSRGLLQLILPRICSTSAVVKRFHSPVCLQDPGGDLGGEAAPPQPWGESCCLAWVPALVGEMIKSVGLLSPGRGFPLPLSPRHAGLQPHSLGCQVGVSQHVTLLWKSEVLLVNKLLKC